MVTRHEAVKRPRLNTFSPFYTKVGRMDATTEDGLLNGRVRLRQPARGYRAGLDAALLAAACDAKAGQRVIEAGCGGGGALLAAASRRPDVHFTGVERDPKALILARENI